ncbi:hypothetical protein NMY22_g13648 [Coprinellus aureogranulatus]|nr:hypothetical protein NMY22_g13648 [Coprinellus aureogranulatus]
MKSRHIPATTPQQAVTRMDMQPSPSDMAVKSKGDGLPPHHPGGVARGGGGGRGRGISRNKHWVSEGSRPHTPAHSDAQSSQRGGRGRGRGQFRGAPNVRKFPNMSLRNTPQAKSEVTQTHTATMANASSATAPADPEDDDNDEPLPEIHEPDLDPEAREALYQELVAAREQERKRAIAEGKMDDPLVPKRLEDAITIVGTCPDMCPRFERYRREREKNYDRWERIPGTMKLDHQRAVKMYERAAGDKVIPSDLRPPHVLRKTLDYLFHDLLPRGGLSETAPFIRDRSRAVRNDFTMQHLMGRSAIECHDRCARFHIIVMHLERENKNFSMHLEEQQLMNTLQSLKEFYEDQRGRYESPTELEMRVYHRLIHIRDQRERPEDIPDHIRNHPVFKLTTDFRLQVQKKSSPISKTSALVADGEAMQIFGNLVGVLKEMGDTVMIYLVACILERLFGPDTVEDIELLRGDLSLPDVIDGRSVAAPPRIAEVQDADLEMEEDEEGDYEQEDELDQFLEEPAVEEAALSTSATWPTMNTATPSSIFGSQPTAKSVFGPTPSQQAPTSVFGTSQSAPSIAQSAFSNITSRPNVFGNLTFGAPTTSSSQATSVFGSTFPTPSSTSAPSQAQSASLFGLVQAKDIPEPAALPPASQHAPSTSASPPTQPSFVTPSPPKHEEPTKPSIFSKPTESFFSKPPDFFNKGPVAIPSTPASSLFSSTPTNASQSTNPPQLNPQAPSFTPSSSFTPLASSTPPAQQGSQATLTPPVAGPSGLSWSPATAPPKPPSLVERTRSASTSGSRASPPPPLKIDTAWSTSSSTSNAVAPAATSASTSNVDPSVSTIPPSPREPPPLGRVQPVSLPSTPTTLGPPPSALLNHLKSNLGTPPATATPERSGFLSPLILQTPKTGMFPPTPSFSPAPSKSSFGLGIFGTSGASSSSSSLNGSDKGKGKEPIRRSPDALSELPEEVLSMMQDQAEAFEGKSIVVRECFGHWLRKAIDKAAWIEACKESEEYKERMRRQRELESKGKQKENVNVNGQGMNGSLGVGGQELVRSSSSLKRVMDRESPQRKRAKKRVSSVYQPPRTDEELAARFRQNQADVERRWAPGSFLRVLKNHFKSRLPPPSTSTISSSLSVSQRQQPFSLPSVWQLWLSLNTDSDATAIWLEKKFDVPESGKWVSPSNAFAVPIAGPHGADETVPEHPGLVIFECSPLDGLDEIEKHYRVVDDMARLSEVVKNFPQRRFYLPSILLMCWARSTEDYSALLEWVEKRVKDGSLGGYHTMLMNTDDKDPDGNFERSLKDTKLDTQGELVRALTVRDLFKHFSGVLQPFVMEWANTCASNPHFFNWKLYNLLLHMTVGLLNRLIVNFCQLCEAPQGAARPESVSLPGFEDNIIDDSDSTYDSVEDWLSEVSEETKVDVSLVMVDIEGHRKIEQDFPYGAFLEHLLEIAQVQAEGVLESQSQAKLFGTSGSSTAYLVLEEEINTFTEALEESLAPLRVKLSHRLSTTARRSHRRRSHSTAGSEITSPDSKRMRMSSGSTNGDMDVTPISSPFMNGHTNGNGNGNLGSPSTSILDLSADTSSMSVSTPGRGSPSKPTMSAAELRAYTASLKKRFLRK